MSSIDLSTMRLYLEKSIASNRKKNVINKNKVYGMLAEIDLRNTLTNLGYINRISQGGWIVRNIGAGVFAHHTRVLFPMTIDPTADFSKAAHLNEPPHALHTICSTMHQIGVHSYYCVPIVNTSNDCHTIQWKAKQLGIPVTKPYDLLENVITNFASRGRKYNFLQYKTDVSIVPDISVPEEFTKEHLRIYFQTKFPCEMSDIDGIFWGQQYTYPIEVKEKTAAIDQRVGEYFGIDVGPFVKLAYYAAKKGNLHSLFIVREIDNTTDRNLIKWWYITYDTLAQFASWVPVQGGTNMQGGGSSVVKIPKAEFRELNAANLALL